MFPFSHRGHQGLRAQRSQLPRAKEEKGETGTEGVSLPSGKRSHSDCWNDIPIFNTEIHRLNPGPFSIAMLVYWSVMGSTLRSGLSRWANLFSFWICKP